MHSPGMSPASWADSTAVATICRRSEPALRALGDRLREHGIDMAYFELSHDIRQRLLHVTPRCLVVDLRLGPGAIELVGWYRATVSRPVLTITDAADVLGRLRALELRVTDHMVAPFAISEATARVEALLSERPTGVEHFADITVDPDQRIVMRAGVPIDLTPRELGVLLTLLRNRARVTSKEELLEQVWPGRNASPNAVEAVVSALRRKLQVAGSEVIHTVHRAGYTLRVPAPQAPSRGKLLAERDRLLHERDEAIARRDKIIRALRDEIGVAARNPDRDVETAHDRGRNLAG
jgi:two-component system OmpR family response regulator